MTKLISIVLVLLCLQSEIFAQNTATASISATIVSPVGGEISGNIDATDCSNAVLLGKFFPKVKNHLIRDHQSNNYQIENGPHIKIINDSLVYDITVQVPSNILNEKEDLDLGKLTDSNNVGDSPSTLDITVNFN